MEQLYEIYLQHPVITTDNRQVEPRKRSFFTPWA